MESFRKTGGFVAEKWQFYCGKLADLLQKSGSFIADNWRVYCRKMMVAAGSAGVLDRCDCCAGGVKGQEGGYTMGRLMPLIFW